MPLKDSEKGSRGRNDLLLQRIPGGTVTYRAVLGDKATLDDFRSHYERGERPDPTRHYKAFAWFGVSTFVDPMKAGRLAESARRRGHAGTVVRLVITSGAGIYGVFNEKTSHLELFGFPEDLLDRVDGTA